MNTVTTNVGPRPGDEFVNGGIHYRLPSESERPIGHSGHTDEAYVTGVDPSMTHVDIPSTVTGEILTDVIAGTVDTRDYRVVRVDISRNYTLESAKISEGTNEVRISRDTALRSLTLAEGVKRIRIAECYELESIDIPESCRRIELSGWTKLKPLALPRGIREVVLDEYSRHLVDFSRHWLKVRFREPKGVGNRETHSLDLPQGSEEIHIGNTETGESIFVLPEHLEKIDLSWSQNILGLTVPEGLKEVTLYGCHALESLSLPSTVEKAALGFCENLGSVDIPAGIESLDLRCCSALGTVDLCHCMRLRELNLAGGPEPMTGPQVKLPPQPVKVLK